MSRLIAPPLSLYLHFPWCVRKCPYCDFNSYTLHGELEESSYLDALGRDLESQAPDVAGREVISIFMGGGTPSLFSPSAIERVLDTGRKHLTLASDVEVTMEANPGTIERGRFAEYRAAGVNRVSLGAQSFNAKTLTALGRIHSPDETRRAAEELHAAGLTNFNLDLMYALPGQDVSAALSDVECAIALKPTHLSHYQLTLEPGTVFAAQPPTDLPTDDTAAEILAACGTRLAEAGFAQYEVSAYAQPGRQCRHNLNYWTFGDYLGVGAGAHGKITFPATNTIVRTTQPREPRRYVAVAPTAPAAMTRKAVPEADLPFEFMLNALRLVHGVDIETFTQRTGLEWQAIAAQVEKLIQRGLLAVQGPRLVTTTVGLQFLNELLLSFLNKNPGLTGAFGLSTAI
ncbi:MAG: radical SAM family heme chaperone HemW [Proteobacteria bacterium]|nr:radical SAM family heme chaperone HemW [Pseudomonadota bacterium]